MSVFWERQVPARVPYSVSYNDVDVKDIDTVSLRDKVSVVFQNSDVFSSSLRENITKGAQFSQEDFDTAVHSACVDEFVNDLRGGYDAVISERGASLSGGQKQRVAIARALLRSPQLLIFDDCTSSLDLYFSAYLYSHKRRPNRSDG